MEEELHVLKISWAAMVHGAPAAATFSPVPYYLASAAPMVVPAGLPGLAAAVPPGRAPAAPGAPTGRVGVTMSCWLEDSLGTWS